MSKINVKLVTETAYATIQSNIKEIYKNIVNHPSDSSWVEDLIGCDLYETKTYTIDDFQLKYSSKYSDVECENGIILYEHLKDLPRYILCNSRFWAWIILEKGYKQARLAMEFTEGSVRNFWFANDARRPIMLNVMGRQYFKVEVSVNDNLKDKYELTKFLFTNHNIYKNFSYRNCCMLKNVSGALLNSMYFLSKKFNIKLNDIQSSLFVKHVSRLGSVQLLDIIPEDEIYRYLCLKMIPVLKDSVS